MVTGAEAIQIGHRHDRRSGCLPGGAEGLSAHTLTGASGEGQGGARYPATLSRRMLDGMTHDFFAPVDSVSKDDRDRAEQRLREAHRLGLVDSAEFEARMSRVITAERLDELAAAVDGPLPIAPAASAYRAYEPGEPLTGTVVSRTSGIDNSTTMATIAHLSPFLLWLFGPALIWVISPVGSYVKREAAKAFNWQLLAFVVGILVGILGGLLPGDGNPLAAVWTVLWIVLTVVGAVKASRGKDWRNPVRALVPWEVLPEGKR